jgi:hypothetical protein
MGIESIPNDTRTENQLIREAWKVQDACNLSGVVFSFALAMKRLCEIGRELNQGTEWKNTHIVSKLWASKIQSLTGDLPIDLPEACFKD